MGRKKITKKKQDKEDREARKQKKKFDKEKMYVYDEATTCDNVNAEDLSDIEEEEREALEDAEMENANNEEEARQFFDMDQQPTDDLDQEPSGASDDYFLPGNETEPVLKAREGLRKRKETLNCIKELCNRFKPKPRKKKQGKANFEMDQDGNDNELIGNRQQNGWEFVETTEASQTQDDENVQGTPETEDQPTTSKKRKRRKPNKYTPEKKGSNSSGRKLESNKDRKRRKKKRENENIENDGNEHHVIEKQSEFSLQFHQYSFKKGRDSKTVKWETGAKNDYIDIFNPDMEPGCHADVYDKNPVELFDLMWDKDVRELWITNTNKKGYILFGNCTFSWRNLTEGEGNVFLALILSFGLSPKRRLRDYWKVNNLYGSVFVNSKMSRNRFEQILAASTFVENEIEMGEGGTGNPESPNFSRTWKVDKMTDLMIKNFQTYYQPGPRLCVDESMIKFKGRFTWKYVSELKACIQIL